MRETQPQRSATEQLLISNAADRAVERLSLDVPAGTKVFVDAANFDSGNDSKDGKYAIGAIRERLAARGAHLVPERGAGDMVMEIRSGALSMDDRKFLIGIPSFEVPVPLSAEPITFPEIALFKRRTREGVAKMAATAYAKDGRLHDTTGPQYGFSYQTEWVLLLFIGWKSDDLLPEGARDQPRGEPYPKQ